MRRYSRKAEKVLVFLFLLFLPTQLGRHFWPEWSRVMGVRVDYLSPTLYFLDVVTILIILFNFQFSNSKYSKQFPISKFQIPIFFLVLAAINIWVAEYRWVAIYRWLRIWQMGWMVIYLKEKKVEVKKNLGVIIPVWIIVESLLGLGQISKGGSLNGWFYWLGERGFSFTSIGVAQISLWGRGLVRAYGTFSHPNSMAGFLLVAVLLWFGYKKKKGGKLVEVKLERLVWKFDLETVWWWLILWLGVMGIVLAGSRVVWLVSLVALIFNLKFLIFKKDVKKIWGFGLVLMGVFVLVVAGVGINYVVGDFLAGWDRASLSKRVGLNGAAIKMIKDNFFWGTGVGNFLVKLPSYQKEAGSYWLQPVHNIFLLLVSEIGVIGLLIFNFQFSIFNKFYNLFQPKADRPMVEISKNRIAKSVAAVVLITGMVDHYWLTLPQNNWILVVFLAMLLR